MYRQAFWKKRRIVISGHESRHSGTRRFAVANLPSAEERYPEALKIIDKHWHAAQEIHEINARYFAYPQSISIAFSSQWNRGRNRHTCPASSMTDWIIGFS